MQARTVPPSAERPVVADEADLALRGSIRASGTPKILRALVKRGESGVLSFWNGVIAKRVFLSSGRIVQITSNDPDERLGELLLVDGRITARQLVEASRLIRPGKRLGAILLDIGALEPEGLGPAITHQAQRMLFDLFRWTSGTYEMSIGRVDESEFVPLDFTPDEVIAQGMRALRCWIPVFAGIESLETVFMGAPDVESSSLKVDLTEAEQAVLSGVNGRRTVGEIADLSFGTSFETCRTLWMLFVLDLIQRVETADVERSEAQADEEADRLAVAQVVDRFNRLFERIYAYVDSRPGEGAEAFTLRAVAEIAPHFGELFSGVTLQGGGRLDPELLYSNLREETLENRRMLVSTGLSELVYAMQFLIRLNYGLQEEAVVSGFVRDGL